VIIGRGADAELALDHASVSRKHAALHLRSRLLIEDLGSANSTTLAGKKLLRAAPTPLPLGEPFQLGDVRAIVCEVSDEAANPMDTLEDLVQKVAASDISVLLMGETGSGKEVMAERLHARSRRSGAPLVRINCAAMPDTLLESELFGYERGAFTGADRAKPGLLEHAHRGTFLLDEVGEMPLATQAKLLRVLEERKIRRVGSLQPRAIDVRLIAATHRDLDALVEQGRFRQDVLFRLRGFSIRVPPLRERISEIPALARLFLAQACAEAERPLLPISDAAVSFLSSYSWPGNIRELRAVMARAALLAPEAGPGAGDGAIDVEHIDFAHSGPAEAPAGARAVATQPQAEPSPERERIVEALEKYSGNQTRAAKALGMTRRMLVYRLDVLGIARPRRRGDE
jgi:transcriptional regulator with GAF, ATPase, and Fis domain